MITIVMIKMIAKMTTTMINDHGQVVAHFSESYTVGSWYMINDTQDFEVKFKFQDDGILV